MLKTFSIGGVHPDVYKRQLYQHRQTSAHRTDSVLAVEAHHFLLLLHGIFLLGVLLVYLVDFRRCV